MKILTVGFLVLVMVYGQLHADNHSAAKNKIKLNLDDTSEVFLKGFIAPVEYTQYNFHVEWDALANFTVAEPEKQQPTSVFHAFCRTKRWRLATSGRSKRRERWHC